MSCVTERQGSNSKSITPPSHEGLKYNLQFIKNHAVIPNRSHMARYYCITDKIPVTWLLLFGLYHSIATDGREIPIPLA